MVEQTLVFIKPEGVARGLTGRIVSRFEDKGFKVAALEMLTMTDAMADLHYYEHLQKPFYPGLKAHLTSGPIVAMIIEGDNVIAAVRTMVGPTNPLEAQPGSIRGDFGSHISLNIIHASDSPESATREIQNFFRN
ncbi:MAG: nucleoside-diphosphate kinase [Candidatus Margulisiibacteriota bacterium]